MKWSLQLSNALIFLHEKKIIHRDLRCSNILVTKDLDVKISGLLKFCLLIKFFYLDFGVSVWFDENGKMKKKPFYVANKDVYMVEKSGEDLKFEFDLRLNFIYYFY
jgi:serine/threonine protein kinase